MMRLFEVAVKNTCESGCMYPKTKLGVGDYWFIHYMYGGLWMACRLIVVCPKVTVSKLAHTGDHAVVFVQTNFNLRCHYLYSRESFAHHMHSLRCLSNYTT